MDLETYEREVAVNRSGYERLREQIERDHAGQYIGLAHGRVVAVAPTFDEAVSAVEQLEPPPECFFIFRADEEPIFEPYEAY
jgi:hypothetical protein